MPDAFADHFSLVSGDYARFRPTYPAALFAWLAKNAPGRALAWNRATGTGQESHGRCRCAPAKREARGNGFRSEIILQLRFQRFGPALPIATRAIPPSAAPMLVGNSNIATQPGQSNMVSVA